MPKAKRSRVSLASGTDQVYQLKVTLEETEIAIWRTLHVLPDISLRQLHAILQLTMGWQNEHLHEFSVEGVSYGEPTGEFGAEVEDDRRLRLSRALGEPGARLTYLYDFGDGWTHDVLLEKVLPREPRIRYPLCVAGRGACPPEDVGGPFGYADFLAAVGDPEHEQHAEMLEWVGGPFDPDAFDAQAVNRAFDRIGPLAAR